ncbi:uncharacterized protein LOC144342904 [Saccoglossus kowalevskii]
MAISTAGMASKIVFTTLIVTTILLNIPGHSTEGVPVKRKAVADEEIDRLVARAHITKDGVDGGENKLKFLNINFSIHIHVGHRTVLSFICIFADQHANDN